MNPFEIEQLKEKVEVLDGSRNRNRDRAAVRIDDLRAILQIAPKLKSTKAAGATPSKAEFDALVDDVHALHGRLLAIASALQARILP